MSKTLTILTIPTIPTILTKVLGIILESFRFPANLRKNSMVFSSRANDVFVFFRWHAIHSLPVFIEDSLSSVPFCLHVPRNGTTDGDLAPVLIPVARQHGRLHRLLV